VHIEKEARKSRVEREMCIPDKEPRRKDKERQGQDRTDRQRERWRCKRIEAQTGRGERAARAGDGVKQFTY
jgi:hypothetical protein